MRIISTAFFLFFTSLNAAFGYDREEVPSLQLTLRGKDLTGTGRLEFRSDNKVEGTMWLVVRGVAHDCVVQGLREGNRLLLTVGPAQAPAADFSGRITGSLQGTNLGLSFQGKGSISIRHRSARNVLSLSALGLQIEAGKTD